MHIPRAIRAVSLLCCALSLAAQVLGPAVGPDKAISELNARLSAESDAGIVDTLARRRAELFRQLITSDPARAISLSMDPRTVSRLRGIVPTSQLERHGEWEGMLESVVADDFDHQSSRVLWRLRTSTRSLRVHFAGARPERTNVRVRIRGIELADDVAATAATPLEAGPAEAAQSCTTTGPQKVAVLMVTLPSQRVFPAAITPTSVQQAFSGSSSDTLATQSANGYIREMSYSQTTVSASVYGPFALTKDYTCDQSDAIAADAIKAADSSVDLSRFTRIAILFPSPTCPYAGLGTVGCQYVNSPSKGQLLASLTWFPMFPGQSANPVNVYAHELGHNFGLGHSKTEDYGGNVTGPVNTFGTEVEYGDLFSNMGGTNGHWTAQQKVGLGWLRAGDYQEVQSSGSFTLRPIESNAGVTALRVLRDPSAAEWLWFEYRQPAGDVDKVLEYLNPPANVFDGALVHLENPRNSDGISYLLDFNPSATPNNYHDAALTGGRTWSDPHSPLTISIGTPSATGLPVAVRYDASCAALQFSSTTFSSAAASGTITVTAPPSCSWAASTPANWITLNGTSYGTGNGLISFQIAANGGASQRSAYITVSRQNTRLIQTGSDFAALSVSPASGAGPSNIFTFRFAWPGAGSPPTFRIAFDDLYSACFIAVDVASQWISTGVNSMSLSSPGQSISDGSCTVYSTGSSISVSGAQVTVSLAMSFSASIAGTHRIAAHSLNGSAGPFNLGIWTIPTAACSYSVPQALSVPNRGGVVDLQVIAPPNCPWNAVSTSPWMTVNSGASGSGTAWVSVSVSATSGTRSGTILIAGQLLTITQTAGSPDLRVASSHTGAFVQGQTGAAYTITVTNAGEAPSSGTVTVTEVIPEGLIATSIGGNGWSCVQPAGPCTRSDALAPGASYPPLTLVVSVSTNAPATVVNTVAVSGGGDSNLQNNAGWDTTQIVRPPAFTVTQSHYGTFAAGQPGGVFAITVTNSGGTSTAGTVSVANSLSPGLSAVTISGTGWTCTQPMGPCARNDGLAAGSSYPSIQLSVNVAGNPPSQVSNTATVSGGSAPSASITEVAGLPAGLGFYRVSPSCRVVDTRTSERAAGPLGPPSLAAYAPRDFPVLSSGCGIPASAKAYSLNATVVPPGPLDFLSLWPAGQGFPGVSTLNSPDGSIIANAAIVPAGANGAVTAATGNPSELILDINGYFGSPSSSELTYYPITPCRAVDTRNGQSKSGAFGPPALAGFAQRDVPLLSSGCGLPVSAAAYALTITAVPLGPLGYLSAWAAGQAFPGVSTLNSPKGALIANAAIVTAGANGAITLMSSDRSDVIVDVNGYFGPPGEGGLHFYPVSTCRVADTRSGQGKTGAFGPPSLIAYTSRDFPIGASNCNIPATARVYSLNVTAVPNGPLDFLSVWPSGQPFPGVSTLNSPRGTIIANAALVQAGNNGAVTIVAGRSTDVILDVNGYFAP